MSEELPQDLSNSYEVPRVDAVTKVTVEKQRRPWRKKFLRALAKTGNVTRSCRIAGISKMHAYRIFHGCPRFAAAWESALESSIDVLEAEARRRALTEDRDALLMFLLRGLRAKVYGDKRKLEHSGGEKPIQVEGKSLAVSVTVEDMELVRQLLAGGVLALPV
jgi:hypothetical protein